MANDSENKIQAYDKKGYLHQGFRIFRLQDSSMEDIPFHYHDFHKLLIFLEGDISYSVEGREYNLQPGNIVLINAGEIHRPVIRNQIPYKRIIAYISPDFFSSFENPKNESSSSLEISSIRSKYTDLSRSTLFWLLIRFLLFVFL